MSDEPIIYRDGKASWSEEFRRDPEVMAVIPLMQRKKERAGDLAVYLYLMYHPRSIYRNSPEQDRRTFILKGDHLQDKEWLMRVIGDDKVRSLAEHYSRLVMLPAERLRLGLVQAVEKLLQDLSEVDVTQDRNYLKIIEEGKKLHQHAKEIEQMAGEQRARKVRGGYEPRLFERRPAI